MMPNALIPTGSLAEYGLRMLLFVALALFPAGQVILKIFRVQFRNFFEELTSSLIIGTVTLNAIYFLLRLNGLAGGIIPVIAFLTLIGLALARKNFRKPALQFNGEILAFLALLLLFCVYNFIWTWNGVQWTAEGGLLFKGGLYADPVWKLCIISELEHTIPPQMPLFAGKRLAYHYFMELFSVLVHTCTRIDFLALRFFLAPLFSFILLNMAAYAFLRRLFQNTRTALIGLALMMTTSVAGGFSEDPHIPFATAGLLNLLIMLANNMETAQKRFWIFLVLVMSQMLMYESILSVMFLAGLGLAALYYAWQKKCFYPLLAITLGGISALAFQYFVLGRIGAGKGLFSVNFPFFEQSIIDSPEAKTAIKAFKSGIRSGELLKDYGNLLVQFLKIPFLTGWAFAKSFLNYYGFILIIVPFIARDLRRLPRLSSEAFFFIPVFAFGLAFPLLISYEFYWGAAFRMLSIAVFLAYGYAGGPLMEYWHSSRAKKVFLFVCVGLLIILPNVQRTVKTADQARFFTEISPDAMKLFHHLRTQTPPESVWLHPFNDDHVRDAKQGGAISWVFEDHYYYGSALSGRRVVLEGSKKGIIQEMLKVPMEEIQKMQSEIRLIYTSEDWGQVAELLQKYNVSYLWVDQKEPIRTAVADQLTVAVTTKEHILYQIPGTR